jgi:hypothetical protein
MIEKFNFILGRVSIYGFVCVFFGLGPWMKSFNNLILSKV